MKRCLLFLLLLVVAPLAQAQVGVKNISGGTLTSQPVGFFKQFSQGQITTCPQAFIDLTGTVTVAATQQQNIFNYWPDGSVRTAFIALLMATSGQTTWNSNQIVQVTFASQGSCQTNGGLTPAQMLAGGYNFDAQIQLAGTASHTISARSILSAAGSTCATPTTGDIDGPSGIGGNLCTYWVQGPIVTGVILEDRATRAFDVETNGSATCPVSGGSGCPLHPIFEAWFWPNNAVMVGATLEDDWASTTPAFSALDETYSAVVTGGNSSPVTEYTFPSTKQITRTRWHRTFWLSGNPASLYQVNLNYALMAKTKFFPNWDPQLAAGPGALTSTYIGNFVTAFNNANTNKGIAAINSYGTGFYPGAPGNVPGGCGGSNESSTNDGCNNGGMDQDGSSNYHGPLTTWDIVCLISQDPTECPTVTLGNADLGGNIPYFFREADANAGHGQTFDNSGIAGHVNTKGRVVSINARTQVNLQVTASQGGCATNYAPDWINFGGANSSGEDLGPYAGQQNTSHWPNLAYLSYMLTGQYAYYEEQVMQSAYAIGIGGDYNGGGLSYTCVGGSGGGRNGAAGYVTANQERSADWQFREYMLGAFVALDGSPEQAYFKDKMNAQIALWEQGHGIPNDVGSGYSYATTFGSTKRCTSGVGAGQAGFFSQCGGTLGFFSHGPSAGAGSAYSPLYPICYGSTLAAGNSGVGPPTGSTPTNANYQDTSTGYWYQPFAGGWVRGCPNPQYSNSGFGGNSNFQTAYSTITMGWMNDLGYCPQTANGTFGSGCQLLLSLANWYINNTLNPAANIGLSSGMFRLGDYVYPTMTNSGGEPTTWPTEVSLYVPAGDIAYNYTVPAFNVGTGSNQSGCPANGFAQADEWYPAQSASAMSYLTGITSSSGGYSGLTAYNTIRVPSYTGNAYSGGGQTSCLSVFSTQSPKYDIVPRGVTIAAVSGGGPTGPAASVSPLSINFGNQNIHTTSGDSIIAVTNNGTANLNISSVTASGPFSQDTSGIVTGNCYPPLTVTPGNNCVIRVNFSPGSTGAASGSITISDNAPNSPQVVTLSGMGTVPSITWSPTTYNFGTIGLGIPTNSTNLKLSNTGTGPLNVGLTITGANAAQFSIFSTTCSSTLAPGGSCNVVVTFTASSPVSYTANLTETDSVQNLTANLVLNGIGGFPVTAPATPILISAISK